MATNVADAPELVTPGDLRDEFQSFTRAMRANNIGGAVRLFGRWLGAHDYPTSVTAIEPRNIAAELVDMEPLAGARLLSDRAHASAHNRTIQEEAHMGYKATAEDIPVSRPMTTRGPLTAPRPRRDPASTATTLDHYFFVLSEDGPPGRGRGVFRTRAQYPDLAVQLTMAAHTVAPVFWRSLS